MRTDIRLIRIRGEQINGSDYSGEGVQCAMLCRAVDGLVPNCEWFVADIEATGGFEPDVDWQSWEQKTPMHIGRIDELVCFVEPLPQLIWGVFLAVPQVNMPPIWTREYWAEDGPPETLDGAMFELRAFDTSYFECYAADDDHLAQLAQALGVDVVLWDGE